MNYVLTIITALLLSANITAPLHSAATRLYTPLHQAYLQSARTLPILSPATRRSFNEAMQHTRLLSSCRPLMDKNSSSIFDISTNYVSDAMTTQKHKSDMLIRSFIPGTINIDEKPNPKTRLISVGLTLPFMQQQWYDATMWYKLVNHALQTSPEKYLQLFSKNFKAPIEPDVWQKFLLADLEERITPENAPSLANALFSDEIDAPLINNAAKSLIFKTLKQNTNAVASIRNADMHELLARSAGKELLAEVMDPEIAMRITGQINEDRDLLEMWADASLFKVISKIIKTIPNETSNLIDPLGKALDKPSPFAIALALQLVRVHPEANRELYPYVKENLLPITYLGQQWNNILLVQEDVISTLGIENKAFELLNTMLKTIPEAPHDFYNIIY